MSIKGLIDKQTIIIDDHKRGNGEVKLTTKYSPNSTFIWQMSTDPDEANGWLPVTHTTRSKTIKSGLESGTRYYFRVAKVDKFGLHPWSNVLNIIAA